jgi:dihydrofolate synthase/folylpolyglutamate synthase
MAVIEARCREVGVPLLAVDRDLRVEALAADLHGQRLHLSGPGWTIRDVTLGLLGVFQPGNAAVAVGAVQALAGAAGLRLNDAAVRAGCASVRWPGRFQVLPRKGRRPTIVLDGAHNPAGAAALASSLARYFPGARFTLVVGIARDKDRAGMLKALAPLAGRLVLTAADHARAAPPAELAAALPPTEAPVALVPDVGAALRHALDDPAADVVCVAGSLFVVGEALAWLDAEGPADSPRA